MFQPHGHYSPAPQGVKTPEGRKKSAVGSRQEAVKRRKAEDRGRKAEDGGRKAEEEGRRQVLGGRCSVLAARDSCSPKPISVHRRARRGRGDEKRGKECVGLAGRSQEVGVPLPRTLQHRSHSALLCELRDLCGGIPCLVLGLRLAACGLWAGCPHPERRFPSFHLLAASGRGSLQCQDSGERGLRPLHVVSRDVDIPPASSHIRVHPGSSAFAAATADRSVASSSHSSSLLPPLPLRSLCARLCPLRSRAWHHIARIAAGEERERGGTHATAHHIEE